MDDLQHLVKILEDWCVQNFMKVNIQKTKVVIFGKKTKTWRQARENCKVYLAGILIDVVSSYKYLGVYFDENLSFQAHISEACKKGRKAMGAIIGRLRSRGKPQFCTLMHLFRTCVLPVMTYGSHCFFHKFLVKFDSVAHMAMRYYLGVPKRTPTLGLEVLSQWLKPQYECLREALRVYNRVVQAADSSLCKKICLAGGNVWVNNLTDRLTRYNCLEEDTTLSNYDTVIAQNNFLVELRDWQRSHWKHLVGFCSRLDLFLDLMPNDTNMSEQFSRDSWGFIHAPMLPVSRSIIANFVLGTSLLKVETGRFEGKKRESRTCPVCNSGQVEHQIHFLIHCDPLDSVRDYWFEVMNFEKNNMSDEEVVLNLLQKPFQLSKMLAALFAERERILQESS